MDGLRHPALGFLGVNTWVDLRAGIDDERALATLIRAVNGEPPGPPERLPSDQPPPDPRIAICPYRGLLPFREEDAGFFRGREAFTEQLVAAVGRRNLVAVVGASGSGKSSVVHAGLLPRLRALGTDADVAQPDSQARAGQAWEILTINPGQQPLHALMAAFSPPPEGSRAQRLAAIEADVAIIRDGTLGLRPFIDDILAEQPGTGRLLLFVDQWEELYSPTAHKADAALFLRLLLAACAAGPFTLVLTMRGDFYGQALADRAFADRLQDAVVNIGPMQAGELGRAIVEPADQVGLTFEDGLQARILADVGGEPGNLPLLEFLLQELWHRRERDGSLTHSAYDDLGGVQGAIAGRAEDVMQHRLKPSERDTARRLLVRLVTPGEGQADTRAGSDCRMTKTPAASCAPSPTPGCWSPATTTAPAKTWSRSATRP